MLILLCLVSTATVVLGQNNEQASASQSTNLVMSNAIDISFVSNNSSNGSDVNMAFNTVNDYANGVESAPIELRIRSNKDFNVFAKTTSNKFTYSGSTTPAPQMKVNKSLYIKVVENNTGGNTPNSVNNKYKPLRKSNRKLVNKGTAGGNNTLKVQYKADPGFEFPAGTYSVSVVYTATQR